MLGLMIGAAIFALAAVPAYAQFGSKPSASGSTSRSSSTSTSTSTQTDTQQRTGYTRSKEPYSTGNQNQSKQMPKVMSPD